MHLLQYELNGWGGGLMSNYCKSLWVLWCRVYFKLYITSGENLLKNKLFKQIGVFHQ